MALLLYYDVLCCAAVDVLAVCVRVLAVTELVCLQ